MIDDTIAIATPVIPNLRNLARAESKALTDALTGLPNRRALAETYKRMLAQARRTDLPLSVIAIDLDRFKHVNDTLGHARGDELLSLAARAMTRSIRDGDFVARIGGDEFTVLLPATDLGDAVGVAERIAAATRAAELQGFDGQVSATFGIAVFPHHGLEAEVLMRRADRALYEGKSDGRACIRIAALSREHARAPGGPSLGEARTGTLAASE
jgi:diguanylate cyclase (GGDEF)-like protein